MVRLSQSTATSQSGSRIHCAAPSRSVDGTFRYQIVRGRVFVLARAVAQIRKADPLISTLCNAQTGARAALKPCSASPTLLDQECANACEWL